MVTDSDFSLETDSNTTITLSIMSLTDSDNISEVTIETNIESNYSIDNFEEDSDIEDITEHDIGELTMTTYEILDDYIKENILMIYSPKFYSNMINYTTDILYQDIDDTIYEKVTEYDVELYNELKEYVEETTNVYLDICEIPLRSRIEDTKILKRIEVNTLHQKIKHLQDIDQPEQKTEEWYKFRYNLITASNLWKVFGTKSQINSLIYEKCIPLDVDQHIQYNGYAENALHWGIKYEPVTIQIYENMYNTTVGEFGCIPHPKYSYIGASPDGINIDSNSNKFGRMIEIKNIVNREITGIPKFEYWIQTQIQMETCDLEQCDFVETRFKEYDTQDKFYNDIDRKYRGIILHFIERPPTEINQDTKLSNIPYYVYMPLDIVLDKTSINNWVDTQKEEMNVQNKVLFAVKYWFLDEISCVLIERNKLWFQKAIQQIQSVWNIILKERIEGYDHRASKKRQVTDRSESIISEDGVHMTVFSKVDNPVCLIKLDDNGNVL